MADDLNDRGPQDRSRISLSEEWEVNYWTKVLACTKAGLEEAINKVGNSTDAVKEYIAEHS